jgi:hypothetical protein
MYWNRFRSFGPPGSRGGVCVRRWENFHSVIHSRWLAQGHTLWSQQWNSLEIFSEWYPSALWKYRLGHHGPEPRNSPGGKKLPSPVTKGLASSYAEWEPLLQRTAGIEGHCSLTKALGSGILPVLFPLYHLKLCGLGQITKKKKKAL